MKLKIITALIIVTALASYVYAQEGTYCYTTISPVCHKATFVPDPPSSKRLLPPGTFTSDGQALDQCVNSYGALGANGCMNETQVYCHFTCWEVLAGGAIDGPWASDVTTTPTMADGPCQ